MSLICRSRTEREKARPDTIGCGLWLARRDPVLDAGAPADRLVVAMKPL